MVSPAMRNFRLFGGRWQILSIINVYIDWMKREIRQVLFCVRLTYCSLFSCIWFSQLLGLGKVVIPHAPGPCRLVEGISKAQLTTVNHYTYWITCRGVPIGRQQVLLTKFTRDLYVFRSYENAIEWRNQPDAVLQLCIARYGWPRKWVNRPSLTQG